MKPICFDLQILARKLLSFATIVRLAIFKNNKLGLSCAKLSSSWLVQSSLAELRFALYLIITTHPQDSSDFN